MLKTTQLLGVTITNETTENVLEYVYNHLKNGKNKLFITTPNPEILVYANSHQDYKRLLNQANLSLPDGVGVFIASGLLGNTLKERIPGVDFMEELINKSDGKAVSIGLLGAGRGIAKRTAECLKEKYPWVRIAFAGAEWPDDGFKIKDLRFKNTSEASSSQPQIDILFVAFGFPKQEEWISKNLERLPVKAAMGVGGAFDYISGNVPRAPYIIRAMGFEWLYRLIRQPWRFKRQLALFEFIWLVVKDRIRK